MRRSPVLALALAALLLPAGLVACGDDGGGGIASGDGFSVEAALAELPVPPGDDPRYTVVAFDLAGAAEANGAGEAPEDAEEAGRWLIDAIGAVPDDDVFPPVFVPSAQVLGLETGLSAEDLREELGFAPTDVAAATEVVDHGPFRFSVVTGDVGEDSIAEAGLEPDDEGVATADDDAHLAADGDRLAVGTDDDAVAGWVDGAGDTLADDRPTVAVATALDDTDAVSALLTTVVPRSAGYEAVGIGWSVDDGDARQAIAYAFPDEAAAEAAVSRVEDAFAVGPTPEQIVLDDVEVDGTVVLARVRPGPEGRPQGPYAALQQGLGIFTLAEG